jgi:2-keto-4-pentenoate hydratase/2-oxohepta-3-ene-1,7-dioic acid hydratase in catechol pathway
MEHGRRARTADSRVEVVSRAMRIVTYRSARGLRAGLLRNGAVADIWASLDGDGSSVRDLLDSGRLPEVAEIADPRVVPLETVELLTPVPDPRKIVCIGLNYRAHAAEAGIEPPEDPTFFAKFSNALAAPGYTVPLPKASEKVDFEAEVALVIARRCSAVDEADAPSYIAGYMLFNDLSARDLQFATPQWMPGKVFDGSAPCGPALVSPDEALAKGQISFTLTLNGEEMQSATTDDLIFGTSELVSRLSSLMTLEPGDIISTGTPSGVGSTRDPQVWLSPGDEIVINSPSLGRLATRIG